MRPITELLREGVQAGQIGGDLEPHGDHAMGFFAFSGMGSSGLVSAYMPSADEVHIVDIGSGVGLPAIVLAEAYPNSHWTLIERRAGRVDLMRRGIRRLEMFDRVSVLADDVTALAHGSLRASAQFVTARSFGPPADTAECAVAFLVPGGSLLTSEPHQGDREQRWPPDALAVVGLEFAEEWRTASGRYMRFERNEVEVDNLPRPGARKTLLF